MIIRKKVNFVKSGFAQQMKNLPFKFGCILMKRICISDLITFILYQLGKLDKIANKYNQSREPSECLDNLEQIGVSVFEMSLIRQVMSR